MGRRVLMLLADEYRPDPRVRKEALALLEDGREVIIISWDRGHNHPESSETEGIQLECVRTGRIGGAGSMALNYPRFLLRSLARSRNLKFDVVHAHDLDTLLLGRLISRFMDVPLVYDAHEHYAAMVADDVPIAAARLFDILEARWVRGVDLLVTASTGIEEYLHPHLHHSSTVVMNCIELPDAPVDHGDRTEVTVFYSGSLERTRYVDKVATAVMAMEGCKFKLAGEGPLRPDIEEMADRDSRIVFLGYLSHDELLASMSDADIVICLMDPSNENNRIGMPNKLFESMALGIPVLVSEGTLSAEVALEEECGIAIAWSEKAFRTAVDRVRDPLVRREMGENGRRAAMERYNWGIMKRRLVEAYRSL